MTAKALLRVTVLTTAALFGLGETCHAQTSVSRTSYSYDRFGNLVGARIEIALPAVQHNYVFSLPSSFLNLPVAKQVALLDQRFGLGDDTDAISQVLEGLRQTRQQEALRRQQDNLQRLTQPPLTIPQPPLYQPPLTIPRGPGMTPLTIPQAPLPQPPIIIPR